MKLLEWLKFKDDNMGWFDYCDLCKEEIEEIGFDYPGNNKHCGRWQCKVLDWITLFTFLFAAIPIMIIAIIIADLFYNKKR